MATFAWVKRVASEIPEMNTIPLFGNAPPFDWNHFASEIESRFGISNVKIRLRSVRPCKLDEIHIQENIQGVQILPIGPVFWMLSLENLKTFSSAMLKPSLKSNHTISEVLQEGFYRFASLQTLAILSEMSPFKDLNFQLIEQEISFEKGYCIEIEIQIGEKKILGSILVPASFKDRWIQHFSSYKTDYFANEVTQATYLSLSAKIGSVLLSPNEIKKIKPGDFLIPDQIMDPKDPNKKALIVFKDTPIFNIKIRSNQVEITDYALFYEDNMEPKDDIFSEKEEASPEEKEVQTVKDFPLNISVEIGKVEMTLDQLMHLIPGNTLDLSIDPGQNVSLRIAGKKIGSGELIYLGEKLGIRIVEI